MEMTRLPLRFSREMISRLNAACEREGIDRSSFIVSTMYNFVCLIERGEIPEVELNYYALDKGKREKTIDIRISKRLKERFEEALGKVNNPRWNTSNVIGSSVIRFIIESEKSLK